MNSNTGSRPGRVPPVASIYNVAVPTLPGLLFAECDVEGGFPLADAKWATFNPSLYQNMDNDQVDWGALAQQWIQMREAMPIVTPAPGMLPPSSILDDGRSYPPPPRIIAYEEQGEAPMEVEKDDDQSANLPLPPMPPPPIICGHDWDGKWQTESITQPSSTSPKRWSPEGTGGWESASMTSDVTSNAASDHTSPERVVSRKKTFPSSTTVSSSSASSVKQPTGMKERWQTKSGHSYPSEHQGKRVRSRFLMDVTAERGPGTKMGVEPKPRLPGLMDHAIKFSETTRSDTLAVKKGSVVESAGTLNDAKRKLLPAWIREGLEKMEKDKQRKIERTQLLRRSDINDALSEQRCLTDTDSPEGEFPSYPEPDIIQPSEKYPACVSSAAVQQQLKLTDVGESKNCVESDVRTTRAQQLKESMRTILTNILLEVTNEEIVRIAKETHVKLQCKVIPAQTRRTETGQVTCIGGVVYGDSDEEEEDYNELVNDRKTDENPENERDDKNSDSDEPPDDSLSDATIEQYLQKRIRRKQREFQQIATKIEQCLDEENLTENRGQSEVTGSCKKDADQPMAHKIECTKDDKGVGNVVSDESAEVDTYRVQELHGTTDLANGTNKDREGIAKVTGRPKDAERKRHNKRISRFSNPRDTVRQTHITHVSIMPSTKPTTISSTGIENGDGNFCESNHQHEHHQLLHPERLSSSTGNQRNPVSNAIDFVACNDAATEQLPKCQENTSKSSGRPAATAGMLWSIESTLKLSSDGSGPSNGSGQNSSKARPRSHERKETSGHGPREIFGEGEQLHIGNHQASGSVHSSPSASMVSDRGRSRRHRSRSTGSSRSSSSRSGHCSGSNRSGRSRPRSRRSRSHSPHSSSSSTKNPPTQKCTANPATSRHGHSYLYRDAEVKKTSSLQSHGSQRYRDEKPDYHRDRSHSRSRHMRRSRSPSKYTSSSRRKH